MTELVRKTVRSADAPPTESLERASPAWSAPVTLIDTMLEVAIWSLASWTVAYQLSLVLGWSWQFAVATAGAAFVATMVGTRPLRQPYQSVCYQNVHIWNRRHTVLALVVGSLLFATGLSASAWSAAVPRWWLFWWIVVMALGTAGWLVATAPRSIGVPAVAPRLDVAGPLSVAGIASVFAVASAVTQRPDADDIFLVNRATYVAQHGGAFPSRDTLFSDEIFRVTRPEFPSTAIEPLAGVIARITTLSAPTVFYLVVGPVAAGLSVLAMWRLLRTLGAAAPALATAAGAVYLALDGADHAGFGNLSFARAWQGKVIFLIVILPLIAHHGLRWARDRSQLDLGLLLGANVAALGLTSTSVFVAPAATAVAVLAGSLATRRWTSLLWGLVAASPAVVVMALKLNLPPQPLILDGGAIAAALPVVIPATSRIDPGGVWHFVFGRGWRLIVPIGAILFGWVFVRDRSARLWLILAPLLLFAGFYSPGVLDVLNEFSGAQSVLWRVTWLLPVPVAVGLAVTSPILLNRGRVRQVLLVAVPSLSLVLMIVLNTLVIDPGNRGMSVRGIQWDVEHQSLVAAGRILAFAQDGSMVLAPVPISGAIAIQTTLVRSVNPRDRYLDDLADDPRFFGDERRLLSAAVESGLPPDESNEFTAALDRLDVSIVCTRPSLDGNEVEAALARSGFEPVDRDDQCVYWQVP